MQCQFVIRVFVQKLHVHGTQLLDTATSYVRYFMQTYERLSRIYFEVASLPAIGPRCAINLVDVVNK